MEIKILGSGCSKCTKTFDNAKEAVKKAGVEAEVLKVQDIKEIMRYGVLKTPGIVIDGELKSSGKALKVDDIVKLLK